MPDFGKVNLVSDIEGSAKATGNWFVQHPRAIFFVVGLVLGQLAAWWFHI